MVPHFIGHIKTIFSTINLNTSMTKMEKEAKTRALEIISNCKKKKKKTSFRRRNQLLTYPKYSGLMDTIFLGYS